MLKIESIAIFEMDRQADAILSNGYTVPMDYTKAEKEFKKMFENPEKYDIVDIIKFNKRGA